MRNAILILLVFTSVAFSQRQTRTPNYSLPLYPITMTPNYRELNGITARIDQLLKQISLSAGQSGPGGTVDTNVVATRYALNSSLSQKASAAHTHSISNITALLDSLYNHPSRAEVTALLATKLGPSDTLSLSDRINGKQAAGTYEANTASNLAGSGIGLYKDKSGVNLQFKRLKAGTGITLTDNTDSVTVATTVAGDPWTYVTRSADTTKGTVAFANIGELEFNMAANSVYEIEGKLFFTRATAANAYTVAFNLSQAPANVYVVGTGFAAVALGTDMRNENFMDTYLDSLQQTATTVTTGEFVKLEGRIDNTSTVTQFRMRWHAEIASNVTLKRGSYIKYRVLY